MSTFVNTILTFPRNSLSTIQTLSKEKLIVETELEDTRKGLHKAEEANQLLKEKIKANNTAYKDAVSSNYELEELLWNYLILSMKLSDDSWNMKWNTMASLRDKIRQEKVPYSRWSEYIVAELESSSKQQTRQLGARTTSTSSKSQKRRMNSGK